MNLPNTTKLFLAVPLSEEEKLNIGDEMAELEIGINDLEKEKKRN